MKQETSINRRRLLMLLGATGAAMYVPKELFAASTTETPTLYYMDGYHGGVRGHMPAGCWRDIVEAMDRNPDWTLSLDVEALSWSVLRQQDPEAFRRVSAYMGKRMEITGGTFSQPYGWAISGESNIRQLQRGLQLIREHFPTARVETYAVQEPCWASCLPQILRSLGFTGASLKNASTAWGGYTRGFDAELVNWIGPDGSSIVAVPRYECEALLNVWQTEATEVSPEYAQKCVAHGIPQPAGMCFQDLGWAAQPRASAPWIRSATWGEYIHGIAKSKPVDWNFSMEDILTALPWGEKTLHRVAQQVREAEVRLVAAEKVATLDFLQNRSAWPELALQQAWDQTLWSQAHDAWITATTRTGRNAWAFQVGSETLDASESSQQIIDTAMVNLSQGTVSQTDPAAKEQLIRVVSTLGHDRTDLVEVTLAENHGTSSLGVTDAIGRPVPCQLVIKRKYRPLHPDKAVHEPVFENTPTGANAATSINTATLLFRGEVPAFGWSTYKVTAGSKEAEPTKEPRVSVATESDGSVVVESDLYRVRFDAERGGAIASLYQRELKKEFCAPNKLLNEFRGYFVKQSRWELSSANPARIELLETGPIRAKVQISGEIGGSPFRNVISITLGQPRIDCQATFQFDEDTWIGDPWDIKPEDRMKERRRSSNDGRWKLQALFPVALKDGVIDKSSAFDVCRSRNASTHFQRWDEIKHNIITNWVDLLDAKDNVGFAILSDRTTAYSFGDEHLLGLILGWGGEGGFWWGRCPLRGEQESTYAILPHGGAWSDAHLWQQNLAFEEPLLTQVVKNEAAGGMPQRSLLRVSSPDTVISSVTVHGHDVNVRLFRAHDQEGDCRLEFGFKAVSAHLVELNGQVLKELRMNRDPNGRSWVEVKSSRLGLRTVRFRLSEGRELHT